MAVPKKKLLDTVWNTTTFLLTKQPEDFVECHRVKIVIVGSGYTGVAVGIAILFKVRRIFCISNLSQFPSDLIYSCSFIYLNYESKRINFLLLHKNMKIL